VTDLTGACGRKREFPAFGATTGHETVPLVETPLPGRDTNVCPSARDVFLAESIPKSEIFGVVDSMTRI
jgi:hypothetical protein